MRHRHGDMLVKLRAHPRSAEFQAWFHAHRSEAETLTGDYYRAAGPRFTTAQEIVSGIGASLGGGRWNPPGATRVIYLSREPETALREANEHFRYHGLPVSKGLPKVVVAVGLVLGSVLDLTDAAAFETLPGGIEALLAEDWRAVMARGHEATTQAFGRAAFASGLHGILVPSKPDPNGVNLLVFPARLTKKWRAVVRNAADLDNLGRPE